MPADSTKPLRKIRSFAVRSARMTEAQQLAFDQHMAKWAIKTAEPIVSKELFGNNRPLVVEIGFGMGDSLAQMAQANPDKNYIGLEVHQAGIGRLLNLVENRQIDNIRVINGDAVEWLDKNFTNDSIERVNIYFPDPWHKRKHHKRRLIQKPFIDLLATRIKADGLLHIATDWQHYAEHILQIMESHPQFKNLAGGDLYVNALDLGRPATKFEQRGVKLGHGVWDLAYKKPGACD